METPSLPFKVLAFGPFRPKEGLPWLSAPLRVDKGGADRVMERLGIGLSIPLPRDLSPSGEVSLEFRGMRDFHPDSLLRNIPYRDLPPGEPSKPARGGASSPIDDLLKRIDLPGNAAPSATETRPPIASTGSVPGRILQRIFSDAAFRDLESAWRGLGLFLEQGGVDGDLSLEIVPVSFDTLEETLEKITPLLVEDLPSLLLLDLPFDCSPRSLELLEQYARLAETLLAPALFGISPKFFGLDRWQELDRLPYLPHHIETPAYAKWRRLTATPAARWLAATCNRFLVRPPYGPENSPAAAGFVEAQPLWIGPAWALASLVGQSLLRYGWPTRFTDWTNIRLENLALHAFEGNRRIATESAFGEDRIDQFVKSGITPLASYRDKDIAFLPAETTVAGGSLARQLFLSRIARLLIWCKDHFPKDLAPAQIEESIRDAFARVRELSGHAGPGSLVVTVGPPRAGAPPVVKISIEFRDDAFPPGERIEMDFAW